METCARYEKVFMLFVKTKVIAAFKLLITIQMSTQSKQVLYLQNDTCKYFARRSKTHSNFDPIHQNNANHEARRFFFGKQTLLK